MGNGAWSAYSRSSCAERIYANSMFCYRCGQPTTQAQRDYLARENERDGVSSKIFSKVFGTYMLVGILGFLVSTPLFAPSMVREPQTPIGMMITAIVVWVGSLGCVAMYANKVLQRRLNQRLPSLPVPR